jgi:alcohol dehydrogenase class IV
MQDKDKTAPTEEINLRKFVVPEFIFGPGARKLVGQYARNMGARKVMVVSDPGVIASGWTGEVQSILQNEGLPSVLFQNVTSNPRATEVMAGAEVYQDEHCNVIVSVGGGSVIDCAKGIGVVSSNRRDILTFEGVDQIPVPMPPLVCIPTTGGSGADVSQFAILTDMDRKIKIAIISKALVPDLSLLDPLTLTTMPSDLSASTGMDALTHAVEAFVSIAHSPITDLHALEAVRLIRSNLIASIEKPHDVELRSRIMLASLYAGMAFSNASLGATHAMAHSLGGLIDAAHGHCNAILLQHVIDFNFSEIPVRFGRIGRAMGLQLDGLSLDEQRSSIFNELQTLRQAVGLDKSLGEVGLKLGVIPELARKALEDPCMLTNPRRLSQQDIEGIYERAL